MQRSECLHTVMQQYSYAGRGENCSAVETENNESELDAKKTH